MIPLCPFKVGDVVCMSALGLSVPIKIKSIEWEPNKITAEDYPEIHSDPELAVVYSGPGWWMAEFEGSTGKTNLAACSLVSSET